MDIRWLHYKMDKLTPNYIYIGLASRIPAIIPSENVALILNNDIDRDFSDERAEIAIMNSETDLAELCIKIKDIYYNSNENIESSRVLFEQMMIPRSIKEIIDIAYSYLQNPIIFNFSYRKKKILYSSDEKLKKYFVNVSSDDYSDYYQEIMKKMHGNSQPMYTYESILFPDKQSVTIAVTKGANSDEIAGFLVCFEDRTPFTTQLESYLAMVSHVISQHLLLYGVENELLSADYEQKLQDIISGQIIEGNMEWLDIIEGEKYQNYFLSVINTRLMKVRQVESLKNELMYNILYSVVVMRGTYLVLLSNMKKGTDKKSFINSIEKIASKYDIKVGISDKFCDILNLKKYYKQAKLALKYGEDTMPEKIIYDFTAMMLEILLKESKAELNIFELNDIKLLYDYDARENTEYTKTLRIYMKCGMDKEYTRNVLNIHRNTLAYRLVKIEEIIGHAFSDGETLSNLYIADKILQMKR